MRDPLEIAVAHAPTISLAAAERLLVGSPTPVPIEAAPWLLEHQRAAVMRLCTIVGAWGGAILADATGLGKTYVALGVARARGEKATVIAPAALREQWLDASRRAGASIAFSSTESLSRGREPLESQFVVIDEAHHFRNPSTRRYGVLARWLIRRHALLLTATPLVNRVDDVVALLGLFLPDDALRPAGIASLGDLKGKPALVLRAWRAVAVARNAREAGVDFGLPRRRVSAPIACPAVNPSCLAQLIDLIDALETPGADEPRALLQLLLFRALASSGTALRASAQHHLRFVERAIEAAREGIGLERRSFNKLVATGDPDQLGFLPILLEAGGLPVDVNALERDRDRLRQISTIARSGDHDPKALALQSILEARTLEDKAVVFVNTVGTAQYLARWLPGAVALTGAGGWTRAGHLPVRDAILPFRPSARPPAHLDARVLVATDVAGEGLDLQGANLVVHYDLPWTAARLAQRVGRVHRLGSPHQTVDERAFIPVTPLAERLQLVTRLLAKERIGRAINRFVAPTAAALHSTASRTRLHERPKGPPAIVYRLELGGYALVGALPRLSAAVAARRLRSLLRAATRRVEAPRAVRAARRVLLHAASRAVKERSPDLVERIDRVLGRLATGLRAGELMLLEDAVSQSAGRLRRILEWVDRVTDRPARSPSVEVFLVGQADA